MTKLSLLTYLNIYLEITANVQKELWNRPEICLLKLNMLNVKAMVQGISCLSNKMFEVLIFVEWGWGW